MLRTLSVTAALVTAPVGATLASQSPESATPPGCEESAVRINGSQLPRTGAPQWSDWATLTGCGWRGATMIALALRSDAVRTETELSRLNQMTEILDGWFEPQLLAAYHTIIRSPDASNAIKLRAMWLLTGLFAPDVDVAGPLQGYMSTRCEVYERRTTRRNAPERLRESVYSEAQATIESASTDRMAPEYVRATARCWEGVIRGEFTRGTLVEEPAPGIADADYPAPVVVQRPVRVVYECDNRFVFYNDAGYDLAIRYSGYQSGVLRVAHGGPHLWAAARFGPVRFWMGDAEIVYTTAVYRPCHSYGNRVVVVNSVHPWYGWHAGLGIFISNGPYVTRSINPRSPVRRVYTPLTILPRVIRPIIGRPPRRSNDDWNRRRQAAPANERPAAKPKRSTGGGDNDKGRGSDTDRTARRKGGADR